MGTQMWTHMGPQLGPYIRANLSLLRRWLKQLLFDWACPMDLLLILSGWRRLGKWLVVRYWEKVGRMDVFLRCLFLLVTYRRRQVTLLEIIASRNRWLLNLTQSQLHTPLCTDISLDLKLWVRSNTGSQLHTPLHTEFSLDLKLQGRSNTGSQPHKPLCTEFS